VHERAEQDLVMALQNLSPIGTLAYEAATRGAEIAAAAAAHGFSVRAKSSHRDLVTDADSAAELAVTSYIRARRTTDHILGEEGGVQPGSGEVRWVIDPTDGTANFARGRADYAVAVAAQINDRIAAGAIVKPATGEWITCDETGVLAHSGGSRAAVSNIASLPDALVSVSVSINEARRPLTMSILNRLLPEIQDFRRTGSTSCDLFAIATGQLDAYIGIDTNLWDIAPGWAIISAAGGRCLRFEVATGQSAFVLGAAGVVDQLAEIVRDQARIHNTTRVPRALSPRSTTTPRTQPAGPLHRPMTPPPSQGTQRGR
jgi:myo-inositol-1(or 4)-monophosphatase